MEIQARQPIEELKKIEAEPVTLELSPPRMASCARTRRKVLLLNFWRPGAGPA